MGKWTEEARERQSISMKKSYARRKKPNEVLRKDVFTRPEFLDKIPTRGVMGKQIALLSEKVKHMNSDEAVVYTVNDFVEKFYIKNGNLKKSTAYIRIQLKKTYKIRQPKIYVDEEFGKVYVWSTKV